MGCGATTPVQVNTPQAATVDPTAEVNAWVNALPQVYQAQAQYMPQMAQEQQQIQQQLYPQASQLNENLATIANQNMSGNVPDWMKQQYQSNMNAQLGGNAAAPIGADYASRGLMNQNQQWQQYYQGLGSSVAAGMPMVQPSLNYMQGFTPNAVMSGMNQNYGTQANIYGSQLGYNSAQNQAMMNLIGSGIGAVGSAIGGVAQGAGTAASGGSTLMAGF